MVPEPPFEHILRLTDERGIFEHADGIAPRYECGYCLDDVARALIVVCRQRPMTPTLEKLAGVYFRFIARAQAPDGRCHNRLDRHGRWEDRPGTGDWWGRALWGLGTAAARCLEPTIRDAALGALQSQRGSAKPVPSFDGVRRAGRGGSAHRTPCAPSGAGVAGRVCPTRAATRLQYRVAVATAAPELRQRRDRRSVDRGRMGTGR